MTQDEIDREGKMRLAVVLPGLYPHMIAQVWAARAQVHAVIQELGQRPKG